MSGASRVLLVYGTRPEAIKLGPVAAELRSAGCPFQVLCTGQHTSLLAGTPAETDLSPAESLGLASSGAVAAWLQTAEVMLTEWLTAHSHVQLVVIQGDTMSAWATARAAHHLRIPIAHVEAGLRSHDVENPWPEELARVEISQLATWHYAPTLTAVGNLESEGILPAQIVLTGNTVVSAMARYSDVLPVAHPPQQIIITLHRREWLTGPHCGATVATLLDEIANRPDWAFVWPVHPAVQHWFSLRTIPGNLELRSPQPYSVCLRLLASSHAVLTDSGGLQEEAATLGVYCGVLRYVTDRPESIQAGMARLYDPTPEGIRAAILQLTTEQLPRQPSALYGEVTAATMVATHLSNIVSEHSLLCRRP